MADPRVDMGSYSGQKGEESPRVFFVHGEKITVMNIIRMWIEEAAQGGGRKRFFAVDGSDGFVHTLYYDEQAEGWFYRGFARKSTKG
jgi:uncharacterized protein YifE (UPF0438 family)